MQTNNTGDYPMGSDTSYAPWNSPPPDPMDFEVTCSQSLSKNVTVLTDKYVPEPCKEDGYTYANTEDTCWNDVYKKEHYTPIQLISMYKDTLKKQLESWEGMEDTGYGRKMTKEIKHLIKECEGWCDDETEVIKAI